MTLAFSDCRRLLPVMSRAAALAIAFALAIAQASAPASARTLDEIKATGTLQVIAYEDNKPFSWSDDDGANPRGIDIELARAIAEGLGVKASIKLRMPGEDNGQDIRVNIMRGTIGGGQVADLILHVPTDAEFAKKFPDVEISSPYFLETVALAIDGKRAGRDATFELFKKEKIGVKLATVSDYFLMTYEDGALINNIAHFIKGAAGAKEFLGGETAAILGVRSEIEGTLFELGAKADFIRPDMTGIFQEQWTVGVAIHNDSSGLADAVRTVLAKLMSEGKLKGIFAKYGVTYVAPPEG